MAKTKDDDTTTGGADTAQAPAPKDESFKATTHKVVKATVRIENGDRSRNPEEHERLTLAKITGEDGRSFAELVYEDKLVYFSHQHDATDLPKRYPLQDAEGNNPVAMLHDELAYRIELLKGTLFVSVEKQGVTYAGSCDISQNSWTDVKLTASGADDSENCVKAVVVE